MMVEHGPMLPHFSHLGGPLPYQEGRGRGFGRGGAGEFFRQGRSAGFTRSNTGLSMQLRHVLQTSWMQADVKMRPVNSSRKHS